MQEENQGAGVPNADPGSFPATDDPVEYSAVSGVASSTQSSPGAGTATATKPAPSPKNGAVVHSGGGRGTPPTSGGGGGGGDDDGDEEEGMLRMSFLEHLEELRRRILMALAGVGVAFVICLVFANELWNIVSEPAISALHELHFTERLVQITPMETFTTVWVKLPMLAAVFLASPWILYQVWAFIAPGLYRRERRWAAPFVICSAGLFVMGGMFGYFLAFRYGLTFLLGIGRDIRIQPMVSVTEYFDLFVNVMLGIGLVFELPILIFFLTLLRIVTPSFLVRNSRYAILLITILAAVVTPTPDVFNMMLFAVPMCLLFYVGIFAGYLLTLRREHRSFPWRVAIRWTVIVLLVLSGVLYFTLPRLGYHFISHWPFVTR